MCFFAVFMMLVLANVVVAQSLTDQSSQSTPRGAVIPGPNAVLWDNTAINSTTSGVVSLKAEDLPDGSNLVNMADDFVVPAGEQWSVTFVFSTGFASVGTGAADGFEVFFYQDAGGLPGALISSQQVPFGGSVSMDEQQITLPAPVALGPGTYWVSVAAVYDPFVDLSSTRWNWFTGTVGIGNLAALQDTGAFFGGAGIPWTDIATLGVTGESAFFALRGTSGPFLPPEARAVPALGGFGLALLAALMVLMAGTGFARRVN